MASESTTFNNLGDELMDYAKFTEYSQRTPVSVYVSTLLTDKNVEATLSGVGDNVAILPKMNTTLLDSLSRSDNPNYHRFKELEKTLLKKVKDEWGCTECVNRVYNLYKFVDVDLNSFICCHHKHSCNKLHKKINEIHKSMIRQYKIMSGGNQWIPTIVSRNQASESKDDGIDTNDFLYTNTPTLGSDECGTPYQHYSFTPFEEFEISPRKFKLLNGAFKRYTDLFHKLFEKVGVGTDIIESLKTLYTCLDDATYGKQQKPAIVWLYEILTYVNSKYGNNWNTINPEYKFRCVTDAICASPIGEAEGEQSFIGFYHTINNFILDLLEKGKSIKAVIKMITNRNDPTKYRQKTSAPKEAHIAAAEKLCAGLENTIHTVRELEELGAIRCKGKREEETKSAASSLGSAFASMRSEAKKTNKYSSFAERCSIANRDKIIRPTTLDELFKLVESGDIYDLKICKRSCNNAYTAKTTLLPSDLSTEVGHMWLFLLGERTALRWTMSSKWLDITHLYNVKSGTRNNYHFIVKNARDTLIRHPIKGNCTLPEFLAPKHRNSEKAFQKLTNLTDVIIPKYSSIPGSEIAFGKACSVTKDNGELSSDPEFIINNKTIVTISRGF